MAGIIDSGDGIVFLILGDWSSTYLIRVIIAPWLPSVVTEGKGGGDGGLGKGERIW